MASILAEARSTQRKTTAVRNICNDLMYRYQAKAHANLKSLIERAKKTFRMYPLAESSFEDIELKLFEST